MFVLDVVGLIFQYIGQVIGWKDSFLTKTAYYVSSGMLNSVHLIHSLRLLCF